MRRHADLASDIVATLPKGTVAQAAGSSVEVVDAKGTTKRRRSFRTPKKVEAFSPS